MKQADACCCVHALCSAGERLLSGRRYRRRNACRAALAAALLLGAASAVGTDIDPLAVGVASANAALNGVQQRLSVLQCGARLDEPDPVVQQVCEEVAAGSAGCNTACCVPVCCCVCLCRLRCALPPNCVCCCLPALRMRQLPGGAGQTFDVVRMMLHQLLLVACALAIACRRH